MSGPSEWVLVPREPTEAMVAASKSALKTFIDGLSPEERAGYRMHRPTNGPPQLKIAPHKKSRIRYLAMLSAAPPTPSVWESSSQSQPGSRRADALSAGLDAEPPAGDEALLGKAWGALNFILAFYEPGQRYLDTEAWKNAEAGGKRAHDALSERLGNAPGWWRRS